MKTKILLTLLCGCTSKHREARDGAKPSTNRINTQKLTLLLLSMLLVAHVASVVGAESTPSGPSLSIERVPDGIRLSWTNSSADYTLEEAATFNDSWSVVNRDYEFSDTNVAVTIAAPNESIFFRLRGLAPLVVSVPQSTAPRDPNDFSASDLVTYLNDNYLPKVWPHIQDFVKNQAIHVLNNQVRAVDPPVGILRMDLGRTSFNLNSLPAFRLHSDGSSLTARFPNSGMYALKTFVELKIDNAPNIGAGLSAAFSFDLDVFPASRPVPTPRASVDLTGIVGGLLDLVFDEESYADQITGPLAGQLGFLEPMRFDPAALFTMASSQPELIFGDAQLSKKIALDIYLVADGFDLTGMSEFDAHAQAIAAKLTGNDPNHVNEPFASFRHALRIWKLNAISPAGRAAERIVTSYADPLTGTTKTAIGNLARFARAGLLTRVLGGDIMVVVSSIRTAPGTAVRASAFGDLVLLPIEGTPAETATTLVHELGHTLLGGLADEYVEFGETYRGLEPVNPNVQLARSPSRSKWAAWTANPTAASWDRPITDFGFEGAYLFGGKIYRPAEHCKMNGDQDKEEPFCQVCREALTRGILHQLADGRGAAFDVSYSSPWTASSHAEVRSRGIKGTNSLQACSQTDTVVGLRLTSAGLPKPWKLTWRHFRNNGTIAGTRTGTGAEEIFTVRRHDHIELTISSECSFLRGGHFPTYTVYHVFSEDGQCPIPPTPPLTPSTSYSTIQRLVWVEELHRNITVTTIGLRASSSDVNRDRVKFEFEVKPLTTGFDGQNLTITGLISPDASGAVSGTTEVTPSGSDRHFRVRAKDESGLSSGWSNGRTIPRN